MDAENRRTAQLNLLANAVEATAPATGAALMDERWQSSRQGFGSAPMLCRVLNEDPDLAEVVDPSRRDQAIQDCTARQVWIPAGNWSGPGALGSRGMIGLLVLEGLIIRRIGIDSRFGAELLGEGDLLRPWQTDSPPVLPLTTAWLVPHRARVAILDEAFVQQLGRYPELAAGLVARAIQRARNLAVNIAIIHQARVDTRLHMLLWHLAGRWGRVRSDGTLLPLRLTHAVLAELVAARRPTVTSALSELSRRGVVRSFGDSWVLFGDPPGELMGLTRLPATSAADAAH